MCQEFLGEGTGSTAEFNDRVCFRKSTVLEQGPVLQDFRTSVAGPVCCRIGRKRLGLRRG
jgi:hypothetical protein